jgi:excinuclease ABC subunit A
MIVAEGTPEQVAAVPGSLTGQFLRRVLPASARRGGSGPRNATQAA